jgi:glutamate 5-kinase
VDTGGAGTQWGTGGMATKLTAARLATAAGCHMAICDAAHPEALPAIMAGARQGTVFHPHLSPLKCARLSPPTCLRMDRSLKHCAP